MKHFVLGLVMALIAGVSHAVGRTELQQGGEQQEVLVAFEALFDAEGRVAELLPHEESEHSAAFWQSLKQRLVGLKVPSPRSPSGQPAMLRTGLYVALEVVRGEQGGQARITSMDVRPLVVRRDYAGYPQDIHSIAGWEGTVQAECLVDTQGRCGEVKVSALPGMPPSLLRWASATLAQWEFQPPQYDGVPIAAPFKQSFRLSTTDYMPVNFLYRGSGSAPFRW